MLIAYVYHISKVSKVYFAVTSYLSPFKPGQHYREKTKQAALAKNSAARMTYMTSTKTCIGTPTTAVENFYFDPGGEV